MILDISKQHGRWNIIYQSTIDISHLIHTGQTWGAYFDNCFRENWLCYCSTSQCINGLMHQRPEVAMKFEKHSSFVLVTWHHPLCELDVYLSVVDNAHFLIYYLLVHLMSVKWQSVVQQAKKSVSDYRTSITSTSGDITLRGKLWLYIVSPFQRKWCNNMW